MFRKFFSKIFVISIVVSVSVISIFAQKNPRVFLLNPQILQAQKAKFALNKSDDSLKTALAKLEADAEKKS